MLGGLVRSELVALLTDLLRTAGEGPARPLSNSPLKTRFCSRCGEGGHRKDCCPNKSTRRHHSRGKVIR